MDEVLEKFEALGDNSSKQQKTQFETLYKNWGRLGNQEERRKEILDIQKSNRNNKLDKFRGILELVSAVEEGCLWQSYNRVRYRPNIYVAGFNKVSATYNNVLMMSEWMIEKPEDFSENWYVMPCPKGVRMLVVVSMGNTKCYSKYGQFRFEYPTALPGGNKCGGKVRDNCCVLDCFYVQKNNTMYVVDLLAWNNQPMTDGETEFRHFWLTTKFSEMPELSVFSKKNKILFSVLPKIPCEEKPLNDFMSKYPAFESDSPAVDGLLFYHKKSHYVSGETPLVGWLFPYMVPEVLGCEITVNEQYMMGKPPDYVNQQDFIQKFEEKNAKRTRGFSKASGDGTERTKSKDSSSMETEEPSKTEVMESEIIEDKKNDDIADVK